MANGIPQQLSRISLEDYTHYSISFDQRDITFCVREGVANVMTE